MILDHTKVHWNGRTSKLGYLIFDPSVEWPEVALAKLQLFSYSPAGYTPRIPTITTRESHFRRHFSSMDTGREWRLRRQEKKRENEKKKERRLLLSSPLSALSLRCPSSRFSQMRKMQIALLRNDDYGQIAGKFHQHFRYTIFLRECNFLRWMNLLHFHKNIIKQIEICEK